MWEGREGRQYATDTNSVTLHLFGSRQGGQEIISSLTQIFYASSSVLARALNIIYHNVNCFRESFVTVLKCVNGGLISAANFVWAINRNKLS